MELGIRGRTALVLGAGGGLGSAIAESLAKEGANVALAGRTMDSVVATETTVKQHEVQSMSLEWDLGDLDAIDTNVGAIEQELGQVEILVNMTGGPPPTTVHGQDLELWSKHFEAMVLSVIAISDRVLPAMREHQWGRIITPSSSGVISPIPNLGLSNALRSTLVGWSKTLAGEVAKDGVTVNMVVPGRIATKRTAALDEAKAGREGRPVEEVARDSTATIPVGRYGDPQEFASVVTFLASEQASYVTGSTVRVDGGMIRSI